MSGSVAIITYAIKDLVLDPRLQCRAAMNDEVVRDYAEKMKAGEVFPPPSVIVVEGVGALVVDGWHRVRAAAKLGPRIDVVERPGTWRDAVLAAAGANGDHGLPRGVDDKRRAVRSLLRDPELAALSSREIGKLARVSHTFVNQVRQRYGIAAGEVLTDDRIEDVDKEWGEPWKGLLERHPSYGSILARLRRAEHLGELLELQGNYYLMPEEALETRLAELAVNDWPWPSAPTEEAVAQLDMVSDIEDALLARDCPARLRLWWAFAAASKLPREGGAWWIQRWLDPDDDRNGVLVGRPRLEAEARARLAELAEIEAAQPHVVAARLCEIADDAVFENEVLEAPMSVLRRLAHQTQLWTAQQLRTRLPVLRIALGAAGVRVANCDPTCGGFVVENDYACVKCHLNPGDVAAANERALRRVERLLLAGEALSYTHEERQIYVDRQALFVLFEAAAAVGEVLDVSEERATQIPVWWGAMPPGLRKVLTDWHAATVERQAAGNVATPDEGEDDEDLDDEEDDEDLDDEEEAA